MTLIQPRIPPQEQQARAARNADVVFRRMLATLEAFQEIAGQSLPPEVAARFAERVQKINESTR